MLLRDLSDAFEAIRRIIFRLDRLEGGAQLENSSITDGKLRIIGGVLRLDDGAIISIGDAVVIDPALGGGAIKFANGSVLSSDTENGWTALESGSGFRLSLSNAFILGKIDAEGPAIIGGSSGTLSLQSTRIELIDYGGGIFMAPQDAASSSGLKLLAIDDSNRIWRVTGGGGSGTFRFPFARSTHTTYTGHSGADWARPAGTAIHAIGPGTVEQVYAYPSNTSSTAEPVWRGNCVVINHGTIGDHEIWSLYAHMLNAPTWNEGDTVDGGQVIGAVGDTGRSDGNHLHFEVIFDGIRLQTGQGGYERTIGWMDANTDGSSWA